MKQDTIITINKINNRSKINNGHLILFKTKEISSYGTVDDYWHVNNIEEEDIQEMIIKLEDRIEKIIEL